MTKTNRIEFIKRAFDYYTAKYPFELKALRHLQAQISESCEGDPFSRSNMNGHITASAMVVDLATRKFLMIKHPVYHKWIQPGGHIDPDGCTVFGTAIREVLEETGWTVRSLPNLTEEDSVLDIDTHFVPKNLNKNEDFHYHHDVLFITKVDRSVAQVPHELNDSDMQWMLAEDIGKLDDFSTKRIARVIKKIETLQF